MPGNKKITFLSKNTVILWWNNADKGFPTVYFIRNIQFRQKYKFSIFNFSDLRAVFE